MSAAEYYGTNYAYPQNYYNVPPQQQYASPNQVVPYKSSKKSKSHRRGSSPNGAYMSSPYASQPQPVYSNNTGGYMPPAQAQYGAPPANYGGQQDGEKGLVATVVGGGAGGALAHKVSHGSKFKTLLGAAAGAAVANVVEHKLKDRHHHHGGRYSPNQQYGYGQPQQQGPMGAVAGLLPSSSQYGGGNSGGSLAGLLTGGSSSHHGHHGRHSHHQHHHSRW